MLIKFFKTKNGGGIAGINYLLNNRVKEGTARVLKGSESFTRSIVKKNKSFVLAVFLLKKKI
ncbi:hypothetical protein [Campylobacter blaseri]|uniref:Mobilization protein n=1 Tax=Campylobacter blaseri TaxID=2042961 RepID=A0A2P8QYW8_9BACT|nr:hypothetical protein [Campylobacter blaseri]PSM51435.1 hypothetical protein CQ405_07635 [Campylobacter blaseri]PSM52884.1 hypothetical protein CRN67_07640 [Campylobacter blaseri]